MAGVRNKKPQCGAKVGWVIWITGLPGAGKTVIARVLADLLKSEHSKSVVLLDGDEIRSVLDMITRYLPNERLALARTYGRLSNLFARQGHTVICATVSMFDEVRGENRGTSPYYFEVFVRASDEVRKARKSQLVGSQIQDIVAPENKNYQLPGNSDLVLDNSGDRSPAELAKVIVDRLRKTANF
jgi:adenylylsulfate kinase-like enzyme